LTGYPYLTNIFKNDIRPTPTPVLTQNKRPQKRAHDLENQDASLR
jgi:hypothetical protein